MGLNPFESDKGSSIPTIFGMSFLLLIVMNFMSLWVIGCVGVSAYKAGVGDCDKTYVVETWVSGDWFCPEERK